MWVCYLHTLSLGPSSKSTVLSSFHLRIQEHCLSHQGSQMARLLTKCNHMSKNKMNMLMNRNGYICVCSSLFLNEDGSLSVQASLSVD